MTNKKLIETLFIASGLLAGASVMADESEKNSYGLETKKTDYAYTRETQVKKSLGKTESGNKYGVYGSSTTEYKNTTGERDTTSNQVPNSGNNGVGVYIEYD